MRIGIMQPYFFPYIGYFQLIHSVDKYVNLDHVSFMKRSYMVRNKISGGVNINLQVNGGSQNKKCNEVTVNFDNKWIKKTGTTISQLYSKFKNYEKIMDELVSPILKEKDITVSEFNFCTIKKICQLLDIKTEFVNTSYGITTAKREEGLKEICNYYSANTYINAIGGRSLYDKEDFKKSGIDLFFCKMDKDIDLENHYASILDILFRYDIEHIKNQILKYSLV